MSSKTDLKKLEKRFLRREAATPRCSRQSARIGFAERRVMLAPLAADRETVSQTLTRKLARHGRGCKLRPCRYCSGFVDIDSSSTVWRIGSHLTFTLPTLGVTQSSGLIR